MQVIKSKREVTEIIENYKKNGEKIGFVPTMGALHDGHLALVSKCRRENDIVVVSIFVNPTQFNDKEDLKKYPRNLDKDIELLKEAKCDIVFCPEENEMYPEPDNRVFELGGLDKYMEGAYRPGHFNGVVQIVTKLFEAVKPNTAYFGEKDFQQLAIIKYIVKKNNIPVEIHPCPIIREKDGLAMSSRNLLLGENERKDSPIIFKTLSRAVSLSRNFSVDKLKEWVVDEINKSQYLKVEYFEIVDDITLQPLSSWKSTNGIVGCIAVKAGGIRLIDNIRFK